jgi:hypothetical protein
MVTPTLPLVKLPYKTELALALIREELKSEKFFRALQKAGLHDCYYQPNLSKAILSLLEMDDGSDETIAFYCEIIERRSKKIEADNDSIMKQALRVYEELRARKIRERLRDRRQR